MKQVQLRVNPLTKVACTVDAILGPENFGDGSGDDGKIWFRVVDKTAYKAVQCVLFKGGENIMMATNRL